MVTDISTLARPQFRSFPRSAVRLDGITPCADGSTLHKCKGELGFRNVARCFTHGTKWYEMGTKGLLKNNLAKL